MSYNYEEGREGRGKRRSQHPFTNSHKKSKVLALHTTKLKNSYLRLENLYNEFSDVLSSEERKGEEGREGANTQLQIPAKRGRC